MFEDLRNSSAFIDDEEENTPEEQAALRERRGRAGRKAATFLGMTAPQRFVLALMVFLMFFALGVMALIATGSVFLPF
jgi:hypothetical protein